MDDDVDASETGGENRGGRGKCILGTCISMEREESKRLPSKIACA